MTHLTMLQWFLAFFLGLFPGHQARVPGPGGATVGGGGVGTGPCTTSNVSIANGINCVQAAVQLSGTGTNVLAYPKGSVTSGNCLIVVTASDSNTSSTAADSQGSYTQAVTANEPLAPGTANILSRAATATGANTVTVTNANGSAMVISEWSGISCTLDKTASAVNSSVSTFSTGTTATTTTATELVLSWFFNDVSAGTFSLGSGGAGMVLINNSTSGGAGTITFLQAYTVSSVGTQTSTSAVSVSSSGPAMVATFH